MSAGRRLSLIAILSSVAAYGMGMGLTLPLLSLMLERMGVAGSVNGMNLATAGLAALVVTPFVPGWIRRFGTAEFLAASLVIAAISLIAIYMVPSLWLWFPVRFVLSAALNGLFVVTEYWINRLADEHNRGRFIAVYAICMSGSFGIGPTILQVIGTHGFAPFGMGAALLLLALAPALAARRTAPQIEERETGSILSVLGLAPVAFTAAFVFGAIDAGMVGLLPVYAVRMGYDEAAAALIVTAIAAGSILFQLPLGYLADRMNRRTLLALCASTGVVGTALVPLTISTPALLYFVLAIWGGLILGVYSVGLTLLGEQVKSGRLATANAGYVMFYCFGLLLGPAAEGVALDLWNPHGLLVVLAGICAAYVAYLILSGRRAEAA
ncbi:MAG: MFS transporter [Alphaproteobacteria bacterium]|nr:MFS transporter [Alphaproteobacteria bacterium]